MRSSAAALLTAACLFCFAANAAGQGGPPKYRFVPMTHNGDPFSFDGISVDMNELQQVVFRAAFLNGSADPMGDSLNAVIWTNGVLTVVDHPAGASGSGVYSVTKINNAGETAGAFRPPGASLHLHPYKTSSFGPFEELGLLPNTHPPDTTFGPCLYAWGHDLNDQNQVVGISFEGDNFFVKNDHIVVWNGNTSTAVPHPAGNNDATATYLLPVFLNNSGKIAGTNSYLDNHGFFGDATGLTPLPHNYTGIQFTEVTGLSQTGWVIGKMTGNLIDPNDNQPYNQEHAFVSDNGGNLFDLNEADSATWRVVSQARDVNSAGHIVGAQGTAASIWFREGGVWTLYRLRDLVTEGTNIPTSFSNGLAINEKGVILVSYLSGVGTTPGLLYPILPTPPMVEFPDTTVRRRVDTVFFRAIDPIDSTIRYEKRLGFDTTNGIIDTTGYLAFLDSTQAGDYVQVGAVIGVDTVLNSPKVRVKEVIYDNGAFGGLGNLLTYPSASDIPDTVKFLREMIGLEADMSVAFDADSSFQDYIIEMYQAASQALYEITDGMFYIAEGTVYNNRGNWDSTRYHLGWANDINRSPLGFRSDGDAREINPLLRFYADNGPGTFDNNLDDIAGWSPVAFRPEDLEANTGAPLSSSILSHLLEGAAPEVALPDLPFFVSPCPNKSAGHSFPDWDVGAYAFVYRHQNRTQNKHRRLSVTPAYTSGASSLFACYECMGSAPRVKQAAEKIDMAVGLPSGTRPNYDAVPDEQGLSSFAYHWKTGQPGVYFNNNWSTSAGYFTQSVKDESDAPVSNARTYLHYPAVGIERLGRASKTGWFNYPAFHPTGGLLLTQTSALSAGFDQSTGVSEDTITAANPVYVESILKEVKSALVLVRATGLPQGGRHVTVAKPKSSGGGGFPWYSVLGVVGNHDFYKDVNLDEGAPPSNWDQIWETDLTGSDDAGWNHAFLGIFSAGLGTIAVAEASAEEQIKIPPGTDPIGFTKTSSLDGELFVVRVGFQVSFKTPLATPIDSISDNPSYIITTNPWSLGQGGPSGGLQRISANHYVATMNGDSSDVGVFISYADADLAQLGVDYLPANLRICSRIAEDTAWLVHETFVDTVSRTAIAVAAPDRFFALYAQGTPTDVGDNSGSGLPEDYTLAQNYPNPFNPSTTIRFSLPRTTDVTLDIFNLAGQRVRRLLSETRPSGTHVVEWDGTSEAGERVASGVYFYRLSTDKGVISKKMMLLK